MNFTKLLTTLKNIKFASLKKKFTFARPNKGKVNLEYAYNIAVSKKRKKEDY